MKFDYTRDQLARISTDAPTVCIKLTGWASCEATTLFGVNTSADIDAVIEFLEARKAYLTRVTPMELAMDEYIKKQDEAHFRKSLESAN